MGYIQVGCPEIPEFTPSMSCPQGEELELRGDNTEDWTSVLEKDKLLKKVDQ